MNREILFKAKRENWKELPKDEWWIEGYIVKCQLCANEQNYVVGIVPEHANNLYIILVDPKTICQYTGVNDEYDKKIFDGDVVTISEEGGYKEDPDYLGLFPQSYGHFKNYTVEFLTGLYQTTYICKRDGDILHLSKDLVYSRYLSVVGNIFDNPELVN